MLRARASSSPAAVELFGTPNILRAARSRLDCLSELIPIMLFARWIFFVFEERPLLGVLGLKRNILRAARREGRAEGVRELPRSDGVDLVLEPPPVNLAG